MHIIPRPSAIDDSSESAQIIHDGAIGSRDLVGLPGKDTSELSEGPPEAVLVLEVAPTPSVSIPPRYRCPSVSVPYALIGKNLPSTKPQIWTHFAIQCRNRTIAPLKTFLERSESAHLSIVVGSPPGLRKESIIPLKLLFDESKRWALVDVCKAINMDARGELVRLGVVETPILTVFVCGTYYDPKSELQSFRAILENPLREASFLTTMILWYKGYTPLRSIRYPTISPSVLSSSLTQVSFFQTPSKCRRNAGVTCNYLRSGTIRTPVPKPTYRVG
ncbi:hypothetical protein PM082_018462 [Marasmius tenuissimus]|nr:hypothetical protein PM082_018462 [Marasmius tenuissimus]